MQKLKSQFFTLAIEEARLASDRGDVPVGAVIVESLTGSVLEKSGNLIEKKKDPTAHAELVVIQEATRTFGSARLLNCDIFVTLEPCPMCAAAISLARLRRLYFGAFDQKNGGVDHGPKLYTYPNCNHVPEVYGGIEETLCSSLLKEFFLKRR